MKEIREDTRKWRGVPCSSTARLNYANMSTPLIDPPVLQFQSKSLQDILVEDCKMIPKCKMYMAEQRN